MTEKLILLMAIHLVNNCAKCHGTGNVFAGVDEELKVAKFNTCPNCVELREALKG